MIWNPKEVSQDENDYPKTPSKEEAVTEDYLSPESNEVSINDDLNDDKLYYKKYYASNKSYRLPYIQRTFDLIEFD